MKSKEFNKKIKDLSDKELKDMLAELSLESTQTRFKISLNEEKNNAKVDVIRKNIARIKTELKNRDIKK